MLNESTIHGYCDEKFLPLQAAFEDNFEQGLECGASLAVTLEGETVVDLWGGFDDAAHSKPWQEDTTVLAYSTTKIFTAVCGLMLIDRGLLDINAPIARYWPEFAAKGKENVLVRHAFTHSAGVPGWSPATPFNTYYDWDAVTGALAERELWWEPGTKKLECLTSELPASNGIGNARSIAQLGSILALNGEYLGHRFLSPPRHY